MLRKLISAPHSRVEEGAVIAGLLAGIGHKEGVLASGVHVEEGPCQRGNAFGRIVEAGRLAAGKKKEASMPNV